MKKKKKKIQKNILKMNQIEPQKQQRIAAVVPKYTPLLYTLLLLIFVDFVINAFSELAFYQPIAMLVMYM